MKYTIRTKLLIALFVFVFIPVFLTGAQVVFETYNFNKDYIDSNIDLALSEELEIVSERFVEKKQIILNSSNYFSYIFKLNMESGFINQKLTQIRKTEDSYVNVYITTETGEDYLSDSQVARVDGRTRPWYKGALKSVGPYMSDTYVDVITRKNVITLSNQIVDDQEALIGVIGFDILIEDFIELIVGINKKYDSKYIIIDKAGEELYRDVDLVGLDLVTLENDDEIEFSGITYNLNKTYLNELNTTVYLLTNNNLYYNEIKETLYDSVMLLVILLIVIITLGHNIAGRISDPIVNINELIKEGIDISTASQTYEQAYMEIKSLATHYIDFKDNNDDKTKELENNIEILEMKNLELMDTNLSLEKALVRLREYDGRIRESEKLYEGMVQSIHDYIWVIDPQGNITYVNESFAENLEYSKRELETMNINDILDTSHKSSLIDVLSSRKFDNIEIKFNSKLSGRPISISTTTARAYQDGNMLFIHCLGRNIKDSKELYNMYLNRVFEQKMMTDIAGTLALKFDLKNIIKTVIQKIISYVDVEVCTIRLLDDYGYLNLIESYGINKAYFTKDKIHIDDGHMGMSLISNKIQLIRSKDELVFDYNRDSKLFNDADEIIFLPLSSMNNKLGVISIAIREHIDQDKQNTLENLAKTTALAIEKSILYDSLKDGYVKIIQVLSEAVDHKDSEFRGHSKRISEYAVLIGQGMYLDDGLLDDIRIAGLLHDIGKIGVRDQVLIIEKENFTAQNEVDFYEHIEIGRRILEPIGLSEDILEGIYYHHKNFDLSGRPFNSEITELPLFAKIIQVADEFDHMFYYNEENQTVGQIIDSLKGRSGTIFCPHTVKVLEEIVLENYEAIEKIRVL